MATLLYRLGKTAYRRWPIFLAAWVFALVALGAGAGLLSKPMSNTFSIPGVESVETAELQQELFPDAAAVDARAPRRSSWRPPRAAPWPTSRTPTP